MKKHLIGMMALSSSLFMSAYLVANTNLIQAQTNQKENNILELASVEVTDEATTVKHIVNTLVQEETILENIQKVESQHFGYQAYQLGHLTLETDLQFNQMGQQEGNIVLYKKSCSQVSNDLQLTLDLKEPIDEVINDTKYIFPVSVNLVDRTAPVIQLKDDSISLNYNASFDAEKYVKSAIDAVDGKVKVSIDNPVKTKKAGKYTVTYSATDKSGNTTQATLKVKVKEKPTYLNGTASANTSGNVMTMFNLINEIRASYGLKPYTLDINALGAAAQLRAYESMAYLNQVPLHYRPDGSSYKTALTQMGTSANNAVEILTYAGSTPRAGLNWWLNSPVHRKFILSSNHTKIGIGFSNGMWCGIVK